MLRFAIVLLLLQNVTAKDSSTEITYRIPKSAIDYAELVKCEKAEPESCKAMSIHYEHGTEILVIKQVKK